MDMNLGFTRQIVAACHKRGLLRNQCAYVLATAYHETAHTMQPVREYGGETYLRSKKYYPYVGMGFVQLTWKANYEKASKELGVDFVSNPRLLLKPEYATEILIVGMRDGWFTGKKLSTYITLKKSEFVNARRIVNGTDKADLIAGYARRYNEQLKAAGYGSEKPVQPRQPDPAPIPVPTPKPAPVPSSGGFWAAIAAVLKSLIRGGQK